MSEERRIKVSLIKDSIEQFTNKSTEVNFAMILESIRLFMNDAGCFISPVKVEDCPEVDPDFVIEGKTKKNGDAIEYEFCSLSMSDGQKAIVAFTDDEEADKGPKTALMYFKATELLNYVMGEDSIDGLLINPWGLPFMLEKDLIQAIYDQNYREGSHINLKMGSLIQITVPCIVDSADTSLSGKSGLSAEIFEAAGPEMAKACEALEGCAVGEAKITPGFELKAKHVIHTAGPEFDAEGDIDALKAQLRQCYISTLDVARANDIHTIAFPTISGGENGFPLEEAVPIAMMTAGDWLADNKDYPMDIIFCCNKVYIYEYYQEFIEYAKKIEAEKAAFGKIVSK